MSALFGTWSRTLLCLLCVTALAAVGEAAKLKLTATVDDLPGVTVEGNASCDLADFEGELETTGSGEVKVVVNESNGTYRAKIKGTAANEAGVTQSFKSDPEVHECLLIAVDLILLDADVLVEAIIDSSKYKVTTKGKARGTVKGSLLLEPT